MAEANPVCALQRNPGLSIPAQPHPSPTGAARQGLFMSWALWETLRTAAGYPEHNLHTLKKKKKEQPSKADKLLSFY